MNDQAHIAFIGLGVMDGPMAGNLARAGHRLAAFNRTPERGLKWVEAWSGEGLVEVTLSDIGLPSTKAPGVLLGDQFYADVQAASSGREETGTLITRLPRRVPKEG